METVAASDILIFCPRCRLCSTGPTALRVYLGWRGDGCSRLLNERKKAEMRTDERESEERSSRRGIQGAKEGEKEEQGNAEAAVFTCKVGCVCIMKSWPASGGRHYLHMETPPRRPPHPPPIRLINSEKSQLHRSPHREVGHMAE